MKKIVVIGGGTMGLDIAHTFARSGHAVVVREISDELAEKSHSRLVAALDKLVARGKMDEAKRAEILGNMTFTTDLAAAADADRRGRFRRRMGKQRFQRFLAVPGLSLYGKSLRFPIHKALQAPAHQGLIVDKQQIHDSLPVRAGSRRSTCVPLPGQLWMLTP
mgnify:CR=1 FL=1